MLAMLVKGATTTKADREHGRTLRPDKASTTGIERVKKYNQDRRREEGQVGRLQCQPRVDNQGATSHPNQSRRGIVAP
jgi:hypothetical protein